MIKNLRINEEKLRDLSDKKLTRIMLEKPYYYSEYEIDEFENKIKEIKPDYVFPRDMFRWDFDHSVYILKKDAEKAKKRKRLKAALDTLIDWLPYTISFIVSFGLIVYMKIIDEQIEDACLAKEKYNNSNIIYMDNSYSIQDVYVIYNVDTVWFCTRKLEKVTENSSVYGYENRRYGQTNEYYYREEIYGYYDIITGEKICQDHEDGFYLEALIDVYSKEESKYHNYNVDLGNLQDEVTIDELLSEEGTIKPKIKKYN